jgi:predicted SprT family Zn-dependent metalloprotease
MNLTNAIGLAKELIEHYKLYDWSVKIDSSKSRNGYCNYTKKEIGLSIHFVELNPDNDIKRTILHEIAHAIEPASEGHGDNWKATFRRLLDENGLEDVKVSRTSISDLGGYRYTWKCMNCGLGYLRNKKFVAKKMCCGRCKYPLIIKEN